MKTIDLIAKQWFDKVNGNSYFSAQITIDFGTDKEKTFFMPFQYGYGSHYEYEAKNLLTEFNLISANYSQGLYSYCKDNGIILRSTKHEKCKKREVIAHGKNSKL